ncbi:MAG TPA: hypothetical protein VFW07_09290 [Parafilimonas sp.]|nr:hypothetical protein [Parafilimonas sp.]
MGWKIYLIAITNAANVNTTDIPKKLGFDNLKPTKEISIHEAQYEQGISIGKFGDKIFIVSSDLVFKFYDKTPSDFEKKISAEFPNSEIAIITINQTSDLYGYNIIENGKRQRVKSGADLELYVDYGDKLPEEIEISKEKLFEDDELKEMNEDYSKEELKKVIDQEISFRTTFRLTKRYFEEELDNTGSDYNKIMVTKFE